MVLKSQDFGDLKEGILEDGRKYAKLSMQCQRERAGVWAALMAGICVEAKAFFSLYTYEHEKHVDLVVLSVEGQPCAAT